MSRALPPGLRPKSERPIVVAFAVSTVAALALAVVYWTGGQPQLEGVFLALALGGFGVGLILWAKRFMPTEEVAEERPRLASTEEDLAAFTRSFEAGENTLVRRGLLVKMAAGALGALGLALVFPIRSLGPRPGRALKETAFGPGVRLVDEDDQPIRPEEIAEGGAYTAFPQGDVQSGDGAALLLRLPEGSLDADYVKLDWTIDGLVAYSKLCTHLGCPVGLYQSQFQLLLCPCHQSTFNVLEGARPVFGPATRPLPQLPLAVDEEGFLVATGDFEAPVQGGFWDRGR